jgi:uncharacterized protein YfeS
MNQVLSALFMNEEKALDTNFSVEECQKTLNQLENSLDKIKDLYLLDSKKEKMESISTTVSLAYTIPGLTSRITQDHEYIRSLFGKEGIKGMNLLYRAS